VLGKTGVPLTILTLGTAPCGFAKPHNPQNVAECVRAAIDLGINSIDTAPAYDVAEEGVGLGLEGKRDKVFLSTKVMADSITDAERIFSNSLRLLKTDHVDLVYFHHLPDRKIEVSRTSEGVFTWLLNQKKAGKARFVGVSGHNKPSLFVPFLKAGEVDVLLTVVNFVDRHTYNFEEQVLPLAKKLDVGIIAMKVFGGAGKKGYPDPESGPMLPLPHLDLAMRYALAVPGVVSLNIGVHNVDQVRKNVTMAKNCQPLTANEKKKLVSLGKELSAQWGSHFGPVARLAVDNCGHC
jgi:predicted aldo/keto reductase-like oxidoreductase